jgi:type II secretory pathway component PulF
VFIIPKFEEIFTDFGVELPKLTIWLMNTSRWVAGNPGQVPGRGLGAVDRRSSSSSSS